MCDACPRKAKIVRQQKVVELQAAARVCTQVWERTSFAAWAEKNSYLENRTWRTVLWVRMEQLLRGTRGEHFGSPDRMQATAQRSQNH